MKESGGSNDEEDWTASSSSRFTLGKGPRYPLNRRLVGSQRQPGRFGEDNILALLHVLPVPRFKQLIVQPVPQSLYRPYYTASQNRGKIDLKVSRSDNVDYSSDFITGPAPQ